MRSRFWLLLLLITGCANRQNELPILSYVISDSGEKSFYSISYDKYDFKDQFRIPFSNENLKNKVLLANFFFTSCPSICPPMRVALIDVADSFSEYDDLMIISHTIDPDNDSIEVLKNYSEVTGISGSTWCFLRGSIKDTKAIAEQFMTNFRPNDEGTDFYHSSYVALIDKDQQIRGFYNTLVSEEVFRLKEDIGVLLP